MIKTLVMVAVLIGLSSSMFACNTTAGAGKDIKAAGQGIQNAANNNK